MVRQVRQRDASPAATEGLAAVAVGTEQIRLSSSMFGGGTKCGQSGTAKHQALEERSRGRGEEDTLREVAGSGWQLLRAGTPVTGSPLDGGLDGACPLVIGPFESQWLDGTGSSVSDTNGQELGGEGGALRDDDMNWDRLRLGWTGTGLDSGHLDLQASLVFLTPQYSTRYSHLDI